MKRILHPSTSQSAVLFLFCNRVEYHKAIETGEGSTGIWISGDFFFFGGMTVFLFLVKVFSEEQH